MAGATVLHGLNHFETTPTIELEAASTNGELKHRGPSTRRWSTVSVLKKQKGAHSAKEPGARALVGPPVRPGPTASEMTPTTEAADVVTLGRSSHVVLSRGSPFRCVAYALRKSRAALSVREIVKVAVDGALRAGIPRGPRLSVMIPTTVAEVAFTNGFWIVPRSQFLALVQEIIHVIEILQETTFFSSTPAKAFVIDMFRTTV